VWPKNVTAALTAPPAAAATGSAATGRYSQGAAGASALHPASAAGVMPRSSSPSAAVTVPASPHRGKISGGLFEGQMSSRYCAADFMQIAEQLMTCIDGQSASFNHAIVSRWFVSLIQLQ
jgi:hypothetical protein